MRLVPATCHDKTHGLGLCLSLKCPRSVAGAWPSLLATYKCRHPWSHTKLGPLCVAHIPYVHLGPFEETAEGSKEAFIITSGTSRIAI
jgi:hypothetical protein